MLSGLGQRRRAARTISRACSGETRPSSSSTQASCACGLAGERGAALPRSAAPRVGAPVARHRRALDQPSSTSRSTMPVTLPFDTRSTPESSLIFSPVRIAVQRRHHVEPRQRGVELGPQPLAQLGLDQPRVAFSSRSHSRSRAFDAALSGIAPGSPLISRLPRRSGPGRSPTAPRREHSQSAASATSSGCR